YESIGWGPAGRRPTATARNADLAAIAGASGIPYAVNIESMEQLEAELDAAFSQPGCRFLNVKTLPGHARGPPRQTDGIEDKYRFVRYVERLEGIQIMGLARQDRQLMRDAPPDPAVSHHG